MSKEIHDFILFIEQAQNHVIFERKVAIELQCEESNVNLYNSLIEVIGDLHTKTTQGEIKNNYLIHIKSIVEQILHYLPSIGMPEYYSPLAEPPFRQAEIRQLIDERAPYLGAEYERLNFTLYFFEKIGYLDRHVVAIGSNGSGKTTLSNTLKLYMENNGVVISAQRILVVPNFDGIANPVSSAFELKESQLREKANKSDIDFHHLQKEFEVVLKSLLAENISTAYTYRKTATEASEKGEFISKPELTNLDITIQIWNSLITHRILSCDDGINITAQSPDGTSYPVIQMSDGEKVMLYLIAQVLQAPNNGFIVIDEPEMYLHKTILNKLWDSLENHRDDCIFIYLTHDLDFAISRLTAKKIWIKSFIYPDRWEIEDIPLDTIPEKLMYELLGSRKNILFCEGLKGSIDERIYSILFPQLTIMPVGSCFDVINHTKAFNKLTNVNTKSFGLIDSDHHHPDRLRKLKDSNVYSFTVAEVENLFLDLDFIKLLNESIVGVADVSLIEADVIKELDKSKQVQASNYVSAKLNYYFSDSDVTKGNDLNQLENNYQEFISKINLNEWYEERIGELEKIVADSDYHQLLVTFNHKGITAIANKHLKISDFTDRSIRLLQKKEEARLLFYKYFPDEIKSAGN